MQVASETLKLHSEAKDEGFVQCLSSPAPAAGWTAYETMRRHKFVKMVRAFTLPEGECAGRHAEEGYSGGELGPWEEWRIHDRRSDRGPDLCSAMPAPRLSGLAHMCRSGRGSAALERTRRANDHVPLWIANRACWRNLTTT